MSTLIDDQDTSVSYAATGLEDWQHGGVPEDYMGTSSSTSGNGNTATLNFIGEVLLLLHC